MNNVPMKKLQANILAIYQDKGQKWLASLPQFLSAIEKKLAITLANPFTNLSFNYVAPAQNRVGKKLVFKCGVPNEQLSAEIAALKHYAGKGAVNLIAADENQGWLLMERCEPGKILTTLNDDERETTIAIDVMQKLWRPIEATNLFPSIGDWLQGLKRSSHLMIENFHPKALQLHDFAIQIAQELQISMGMLVLLHGDLHHYNILSHGTHSWLSIDPKGVIGEKEYDIGAFMRNPMPDLLTKMNSKKIVRKRLDQIIEQTGFDRKRITYWCLIQAVLAAGWCIEDQIPGADYMLACAEIFYNLR